MTVEWEKVALAAAVVTLASAIVPLLIALVRFVGWLFTRAPVERCRRHGEKRCRRCAKEEPVLRRKGGGQVPLDLSQGPAPPPPRLQPSARLWTCAALAGGRYVGELGATPQIGEALFLNAGDNNGLVGDVVDVDASTRTVTVDRWQTRSKSAVLRGGGTLRRPLRVGSVPIEDARFRQTPPPTPRPDLRDVAKLAARTAHQAKLMDPSESYRRRVRRLKAFGGSED